MSAMRPKSAHGERSQGGLKNASGSASSSGNVEYGRRRHRESACGVRRSERCNQSFADLITDAVGQVNQLEAQAQTAVTGLMTGSGVDVHQAMIATQKARHGLRTGAGSAQQSGSGLPERDGHAVLKTASSLWLLASSRSAADSLRGKEKAGSQELAARQLKLWPREHSWRRLRRRWDKCRMAGGGLGYGAWRGCAGRRWLPRNAAG